MSETNENKPAEATAPVIEGTPVPIETAAPGTEASAASPAPAATTPAAAASGAPDKRRGGKGPFRERPKQERPQLDLREISTGLNLKALDDEIESELANSIAGFDKIETPAAAIAHNEVIGASIKLGTKIQGTVASIHGSDVFMDIPGSRTQGFLSKLGFTVAPSVGDRMELIVDGLDPDTEMYKLAKPGMAVIVDWSSVAVGQTVEARVVKTNKGGLEVEVNGIRGFMPIGHIDLARVENAEVYVNQRLTARVIEVNPSDKKLVVSRRSLLEYERKRLADDFWNTLEEGQVHKGTVSSLQKFGAFVNLGAADGLIPMGELAWGRVNNASDVLQIGQAVEVKIKRLDRAARKIGLSLKDLVASPWTNLSSRFPVGSRVTAKATRVTEFGAFMEIEPGIEGMLHISEMAGRVNRVRDQVQEGTTLEVQIIRIETEAKRIALSTKAIADTLRREENAKSQAEAAAKEAEAAAAEDAAAASTQGPAKKKKNIALRGGGGSGFKFG